MLSISVSAEEFICLLTLEVMTEPVMTKLGHNFDLSALLKWLELDGCCPLTRNPLAVRDIIVRKALKGRIEMWRKQTGQGEDESEKGESHKKLPLFLAHRACPCPLVKD
jgi:hypothetical protein